MNKLKKVLFFTLCFILLFIFPLTSFAHSGRTDSSGGHHDYKNKSGLGSYHYHCGGNPPHLHENGVCPYSSSTSINAQPKPSININGISTTMNVGDTCKFDATIEDASNTNIQVTSSDNNVIFVNYDKTLSAKGVGTSTVTIGNDTVSKSFTITVKEVYATDLEISINPSELQIGDTLKIKADISPLNATNKSITYKSSDDNIATISNNGVIKGISSGIATITATTSNGISKSIDITIFEVVPELIKCDECINLIVGDNYDLQVEILPENCNNKNFDITLDNNTILQYSDNKLEAIKEGQTAIHIKTWNGIEKEIQVKVDIIPVQNIKIIDSTEYLISNIIDKSDKIALKVEINPDNATYQDIKWSSSDNKIVTVADNNFIIKGTGKVTLTCITHNNIRNKITLTIIDIRIIILTCVCIFSIATVLMVFIIIRYRKHKINKR